MFFNILGQVDVHLSEKEKLHQEGLGPAGQGPSGEHKSQPVLVLPCQLLLLFLPLLL